MKTIQNNENRQICSTCKKVCCKTCSGAVFPFQLHSLTIESLSKLISEDYCFDYWEGNPTNEIKYEDKTAYFLRPKHINALNRKIDPSWGGICVFLTSSGCKLSFNERPAMCQALTSNIDTDNCELSEKFSKRAAAIAWLPYNEIIEDTLYLRKKIFKSYGKFIYHFFNNWISLIHFNSY